MLAKKMWNWESLYVYVHGEQVIVDITVRRACFSNQLLDFL